MTVTTPSAWTGAIRPPLPPLNNATRRDAGVVIAAIEVPSNERGENAMGLTAICTVGVPQWSERSPRIDAKSLHHAYTYRRQEQTKTACQKASR